MHPCHDTRCRCVDHTYEITSRSGDLFRLETVAGLILSEIVMRRSGELLAVQIRGDTEVYAKGPDSQSSPPTCDGTPPQNLQDLWATTSSPVHYLNITGAAFEVHLPVTEGCREIWSIIPYVWEESAGGGTTVYGRERWSGDHFQFDLRRDDAWLVRNNSWTYERAEAPDLPACPPVRLAAAAERQRSTAQPCRNYLSEVR